MEAIPNPTEKDGGMHLSAIARTFSGPKDFSDFPELAYRVVQAAKNIKPDTDRADVLRNIGKYLAEAKDIHSLKPSFALALELIGKAGMPHEKRRVSQDLAGAYARCGDLDRAIRTVEQIDPTSTEYSNALVNIAIAQARRGEFHESLGTIARVTDHFRHAFGLSEIAETLTSHRNDPRSKIQTLLDKIAAFGGCYERKLTILKSLAKVVAELNLVPIFDGEILEFTDQLERKVIMHEKGRDREPCLDAVREIRMQICAFPEAFEALALFDENERPEAEFALYLKAACFPSYVPDAAHGHRLLDLAQRHSELAKRNMTSLARFGLRLARSGFRAEASTLFNLALEQLGELLSYEMGLEIEKLIAILQNAWPLAGGTQLVAKLLIWVAKLRDSYDKPRSMGHLARLVCHTNTFGFIRESLLGTESIPSDVRRDFILACQTHMAREPGTTLATLRETLLAWPFDPDLGYQGVQAFLARALYDGNHALFNEVVRQCPHWLPCENQPKTN